MRLTSLCAHDGFTQPCSASGISIDNHRKPLQGHGGCTVCLSLPAMGVPTLLEDLGAARRRIERTTEGHGPNRISAKYDMPYNIIQYATIAQPTKIASDASVKWISVHGENGREKCNSAWQWEKSKRLVGLERYTQARFFVSEGTLLVRQRYS